MLGPKMNYSWYMKIIRFQVDALNVEIHPDSESAGRAAACAAAQLLRELAAERENIGVVFATGASQLDTLRAMVTEREVPWSSICGFHLDEYIGLDENHPASFRHYLRDNLTRRVAMREFNEINGNAEDPESVCREYAAALRKAEPQLCLLGVGENGHLAFNDPNEADFSDPEPMKVVTLDAECRQQQAAEGWFEAPEDVPLRALTLTIPTLFRIPRLIVSVPGGRKAQIIRRALREPISTHCPATILRTHPAATLYLDLESAADLKDSMQL
jgi:glucosamine-6-phosphate deaminase